MRTVWEMLMRASRERQRETPPPAGGGWLSPGLLRCWRMGGCQRTGVAPSLSLLVLDRARRR